MKYSEDFKEHDASEGFEDKFELDPHGYLLIRIKDGKIELGRCKKPNELDIIIKGNNAKEICQKAIKLNLISRLDHAAYLGRELQKAEFCLKNNKEYVQE